MLELTETVKAVDAALFPNFQAQGSVFEHPDVYAAPEIESSLKRCALPEVKAVASGRKRLDPPAAFIAQEVVGHID
jgi:hypothetical protein